MKRRLNLTIYLNQDDFDVYVCEPESGLMKHLEFPFSPDEHPEFDQSIGAEIYSWISLWKDESEEIEDD